MHRTEAVRDSNSDLLLCCLLGTATPTCHPLSREYSHTPARTPPTAETLLGYTSHAQNHPTRQLAVTFPNIKSKPSTMPARPPSPSPSQAGAGAPPSAFSEPSEPSQLRPEDTPEATLRGPQAENPQLVAHVRGKQAGDAAPARRPSGKTAGGGGEGRAAQKREGADEEKRADVAGGGGRGRAKL
ncbi:hypothetical protein BC628DRAFT_1344775 [Trametes gibbosa]|nr:hypothetical protein BC628DRAFT_1344775 [Trametes gibbosa]